jgi:phosphate starvation-inducible PhoH-like protein
LKTSLTSRSFLLEPNDSRKLAEVCGQFNEHLKLIESTLKINILSRGNSFQLQGTESNVLNGERIIKRMHHHCYSSEKSQLSLENVHILIQESKNLPSDAHTEMKENFMREDTNNDECIYIETPRKTIESRGANQALYLKSIEKHDINFGIGPAGTGKTYLAVACAVAALKQEEVNRIVLVRPAVEAGEKLGFLPGDLNEKVNPYLRPLYDALYDMLGFETVEKMLEKQIIEIAPLAFMRGRTLNNAFIILDESQNTTKEQMKMFLTRIGFGAKAVITGDVTQIDLPKGTDSGLIHAIKVLGDIKQIGFSHFTSKDIVRHKLVQQIVEAYASYESKGTLETISKKHN